jgi:hypothetical protein
MGCILHVGVCETAATAPKKAVSCNGTLTICLYLPPCSFNSMHVD